MDDLSATVAHLIHFVVTAISMKYFEEPFAIHGMQKPWAVRAFQILLVYSFLGILYNANSYVHDNFRKLYLRFYDITGFAPFFLIVIEILRIYNIGEIITTTLLIVTSVTVAYEFVVTYEFARKDRLRRPLIELTVVLNLLALFLIGLRTENYFAVSLAVSFAFTHYFSEMICNTYFEYVPPRGLFPYSLCFMEIFAISTLKNA